MKTKVKIISVFLLSIIIIGCNNAKNPDVYLQKVLENLEKIESATYFLTRESWQPGDTAASRSYNFFFKEYDNPKDTTIGASFVWFDADNTAVFEIAYDGNIRASTYHEEKRLVINDFSSNQLPFRPIAPPFFNYVKNIISYALNTEDSISVTLEDLGDDYYFKLIINEDRQIEFFGKAYRMPGSVPFDDPTSIYELWISKSNDLPYKYRREMSHSISVETCFDIEYNKMSTADFNIYSYFPEDYELRQYEEFLNVVYTSNLIDKKAPEWILKDTKDQDVSLSELKSKVLLVNFTGIGCGVCVLSIPFLNELSSNYNINDFELIGIETWSGKLGSVKNYAAQHALNYRILSGTSDLAKEYETGGFAPFFFVLDDQRIIRNVIKGYSQGTTEKEIRDAIAELL